jgi:phosphatidylglycerol---prolipoprotein diacylglyceryl transferase
MYPRLSDIINDIFGTNIVLPIQSYGFMVAMAFLSATWIVWLELKRKEKIGQIKAIEKEVWVGKPASLIELIITGIISLLIGYKVGGMIFQYSQFVENPQEYLLSGKGSWIVGILIAAASVYLKFREKNKKKLEKPRKEKIQIHPYQLAGNMVVIAAVAGIIGAKIFHNLENLDELIEDPMGAIFSFSGLTFYGGLIAGALSVSWYAHKNGINWHHLADCAAPAIMLAYGVGRIGCMVSGDGCWGIENLNPKPEWLVWLPDWLWAFDFPHNVINEGVPIPNCNGDYCHVLKNPVYPTPIYETTISLLWFGLLMFLRTHIKTPGILFSIFLILNGIERFFIEKIRVNNKMDFLGMKITQAEIISTCLVIIGLIGLWYFTRYYKKKKEIQSPKE